MVCFQKKRDKRDIKYISLLDLFADRGLNHDFIIPPGEMTDLRGSTGDNLLSRE